MNLKPQKLNCRSYSSFIIFGCIIRPLQILQRFCGSATSSKLFLSDLRNFNLGTMEVRANIKHQNVDDFIESFSLWEFLECLSPSWSSNAESVLWQRSARRQANHVNNVFFFSLYLEVSLNSAHICEQFFISLECYLRTL